MSFVLDAYINLVALVFLAILGTITGVALPGLFLAVVAPWLDRFLPLRKRQG